MMNSGAKFVVIGARGGCGREIVRLLSEKPADEVAEIVALVRNVAKVEPGTFPPDSRVKLQAGDCADVESLRAPFEGASGVFYAAAGKGYEGCKAVDQEGVDAAARIALEVGVGRFVLLSSGLVHPSNKYNVVRGVLNTINSGLFKRWGMMDFKFAGEQLLRRSGQEYCIVRPSRLFDGSFGSLGPVKIGQTNSTFLQGSGITRADVASVCIAAASAASARNTTFEVAAAVTAVSASLVPTPLGAALFDGLDAEWDEAWKGGILDADVHSSDCREARRCW